MNKPQSVLRKWMDLGDEKKNILFRDPYPHTGEGAPRVQRLTDFFVLMKKLGENPNPSGSGAMLAMVKGLGLVLTAPHIGIPVLLGSKAAARMLFNPESSRWMMQALKMPATAKGAPLLAKQIINAAGPDVDTVTTGTGEAMAPAAATVQTSGGGGLNAEATTTGPGESGTVRSEIRASAENGARAAGGQKRSNVTTVELAGKPGQGYKARYEISELGDSTASHNGLTFEENPTYPYKNQRNYKTAVNQQKVIVGSSEAGHNPRLHVEPSADAVNGPPVEDARKNVLSGNGRHQMQERIYAAGGNAAKRLRDAIAEQARQIEGLNPDDAYRMKRPSLRLVIDDEEFARRGPGAKQNFIADTNVAGTASLTAGEQMISDSRRVSDATVNHVGGLLEGIGPDATLSQALDGRAGAEVLNKLVDDGVIPDQSRAAYVKETKLGDVLTEEGKERVTRLMVGRFFEHPDQLSKLPEARNQVERIAAPLSQVDSIPDWSLTPKVQEAVGILERAHDLGVKNLDDFFQQDNIFGAAKYSAEAVDLARAIKSAPAEVIKGAARQYAGDAIEASRGASMFGDVSTPGDAFKAAFAPEALEKRAAELKALRDAARKPAPANALAEVTPAAAEPANALAPKQPRKPRSKK
jgi:cell division septum initiation protein DivIVA